MDGTILEKKLQLVEKLKELDELAQKVIDMPTFTSNDRAFLEELPAFPEVDGKKALVATTESGDTSLNYEELSDLPADPESDGERVLKATTTNGVTIKSWGTLTSGTVYSTTETEAGTWYGKKLFRRVFEFNIASSDYTTEIDSNPIYDKAMIEFGVCWFYQGSDLFGVPLNAPMTGTTQNHAYPVVRDNKLLMVHFCSYGAMQNQKCYAVILYTKKTT